MHIKQLLLPGAKMIEREIQTDSRGSFHKPFTILDISTIEEEFNIAEIFYSISKMNVIRGMHFQNPPSEQRKIITVVKGRITDLLLDLRKSSKFYGKFISIELNAKDGVSIFIPNGIAHGFIGKDKENIVLYVVDSAYSKEDEDGIRYDSFGYSWGVKEPILSPRDRSFQGFEDFVTHFK